MDKLTIEKVREVMCDFVNAIICIADEGDYDRDSFVTAIANMFAMMVEISTFENFKTSGVVRRDHNDNGAVDGLV